MRVLMISDVYFPRINGVSTSIQTFRRDLAALGHEVALIAPRYPRTVQDDPGIQRVASAYLPLDPEDRLMYRRAVLALEPALRKRQFNLVHIQTPFIAHYAGVALSKRLAIPRLETYHTFFEEYLYHYIRFAPRPWTRALARRFSQRQCNDLAALVVPSRAMRDVLLGYGVRTPMRIIPTGLTPDRFVHGDGATFRMRHDIAPDRPVLVHVGRVAHEKNIDFLLRVLLRLRQRIADVLLLICGEGPALPHLKRLTATLGLEGNVLFVGYLDRDRALLDCYRAGNAFVFASRTETQGLVLLEAMAQGVPVISTAIMGTRDILETGRGALVCAEDEADFAEKTLQLLGSPELQSRLGAEASAQAAEWSSLAMAERMAELYRSLVAGNAPSYTITSPRSA